MYLKGNFLNEASKKTEVTNSVTETLTQHIIFNRRCHLEGT